ncbi:hypothetical protein [Allorhizobium borbori]|uniref:Uncharacterized protein n=1 Tax=Allorhizobium borbori TaxID=485907 RepID=A0A7W6K4C7_9HYPH|nr:hypothetical protein [Allorhizobium borbori]MBB4104966.1 hypothetical protein [Allorhizobium borbori]
MMKTRYEEKMERIRAGRYAKGDFIIADAKDADLSGGILTTGRRRDAEGRVVGNRTRAEFLAEIEALVKHDMVDIMLASTSSIESLQSRKVFAGSRVMPAFRANDTTDVWGVVRGGNYRTAPSLPYSGTDLTRAQADLCLYSMTFNNDAAADMATLEAYRDFRPRLRAAGKRHFLEVFNPNMPTGFDAGETGMYVNDCIVRTLASLTDDERPEFLKVAYNGPAALEELVAHDSSVVVGVLGGGTGTHRDTFELVWQAEKFGARLALFGRKINLAEHQPSFITWMRAVADGNATPAEAVRGYHGHIVKLGLAADRQVDDDLLITEEVLLAAAER